MVLLKDVAFLPLQPQERVILRDLIDCEYSSYKRIEGQIWDMQLDPPLRPHDGLRVRLTAIRKRLRPGWKIVALYGQGLRLEHDVE